MPNLARQAALMAKMNWDRVRAERSVGHRLDGPPRSRPKRRNKPGKAHKRGYRQCQATTKRGARCKGGAMPGTPHCGPHQHLSKSRTDDNGRTVG